MIRAVLVVSRYHIPLVNQIIDQQNVQIVAIVTDNRSIAIESGCPSEIAFSFWQLKTVLEIFDFDYLIVLSFYGKTFDLCKVALHDINLPMIKLCNLSEYPAKTTIDLLACLHDLKRNSTKYKIFATGISYSQLGIVPENFELPVINFAFTSQDLYYDFQIAKKIIQISTSLSRKNFEEFQYTLTGLAPYSLHYDLSRCNRESYVLSKYLFALNDLHNYWIDAKIMHQILLPEFVEEHKSKSENLDYRPEFSTDTISLGNAIEAYYKIDEWNRKNYPETVSENKQILEKYLQLLESNRIFPILFLPPMMKDYQDRFCREKLRELIFFLKELLQSYDFIFINGWMLDGFDDCDFRDIDHLNVYGSQKFSIVVS